MSKIKVQIVNKSNNVLPFYAKLGDAGMDIKAWVTPEHENVGDNSFMIEPLGKALIHTGIYCKIPIGYQIEIRPRSGLAFKHGITVLNAPGTIDENYIGEIGVILYNAHPDESFVVQSGDRIAQLVLMESPKIEWDEVKELEATDRGTGGFGHSGMK